MFLFDKKSLLGESIIWKNVLACQGDVHSQKESVVWISTKSEDRSISRIEHFHQKATITSKTQQQKKKVYSLALTPVTVRISPPGVHLASVRGEVFTEENTKFEKSLANYLNNLSTFPSQSP